MRIHGITLDVEHCEENKDIEAEFSKFASICQHLSISDFIKNVTYDQKLKIFQIETLDLPSLHLTDAGIMIERCAFNTLPSFILFDILFCKIAKPS